MNFINLDLSHMSEADTKASLIESINDKHQQYYGDKIPAYYLNRMEIDRLEETKAMLDYLVDSETKIGSTKDRICEDINERNKVYNAFRDFVFYGKY